MIRYFHSIIFDKPTKPITKQENDEIIIDSLIEKIDKHVDMSLIIKYDGYIYGPCIRNILSNQYLKDINVAIPSEGIFSYIEELKSRGYEYNYELSLISDTYYMCLVDNISINITENTYTYRPDFDIDILMYDGYILSNINKYDTSIIETYEKISKKQAKVISNCYDYSLKDKGFEIIF